MPRSCWFYVSSPISRAFRSPFAPLAPSSGEVYSLGEWRMPAMLGTQTMPAAVMADMAWASCPAPLGMEREASPRRRAAAATTVARGAATGPHPRGGGSAHGDHGRWG